MVVSVYFRNQFISEKYAIVPLLELQSLKNSPLVHLYTSARDCKGIGNIPGSYFVKSFPALP
jgi:hypothetical protein